MSLELQALGRIDQNSLESWCQEFNQQRPYEVLGMRCPSELYQQSARRHRGGVQQLDYPQMIGRRVNKNGKINWANHQLFISSLLAGWSVGLKPVEQEQLERGKEPSVDRKEQSLESWTQKLKEIIAQRPRWSRW